MKILIEKALLEEAISGLKTYGQVATEITVEKIEAVIKGSEGNLSFPPFPGEDPDIIPTCSYCGGFIDSKGDCHHCGL